MKFLIVAVLWVLVGVLLWMRTMRVYGRKECFNGFNGGDEWSGPCCTGPRCKHPSKPHERLADHVTFAPFFLVASLWYNGPWRWLKAIGDAATRSATRFAEWYAPPDVDDDAPSTEP